MTEPNEPDPGTQEDADGMSEASDHRTAETTSPPAAGEPTQEAAALGVQDTVAMELPEHLRDDHDDPYLPEEPLASGDFAELSAEAQRNSPAPSGDPDEAPNEAMRAIADGLERYRFDRPEHEGQDDQAPEDNEGLIDEDPSDDDPDDGLYDEDPDEDPPLHDEDSDDDLDFEEDPPDNDADLIDPLDEDLPDPDREVTGMEDPEDEELPMSELIEEFFEALHDVLSATEAIIQKAITPTNERL